MIFSSRLGATEYELDDTDINIKLTRWNLDGKTDFWVPKDLLHQYCKHYLRLKLDAMRDAFVGKLF